MHPISVVELTKINKVDEKGRQSCHSPKLDHRGGYNDFDERRAVSKCTFICSRPRVNLLMYDVIGIMRERQH